MAQGSTSKHTELGVLKEGTIEKWTNYYSSWKERYFVVEPGLMNYSNCKGDPAKNIIMLNAQCKVRRCPGEECGFEIQHNSGLAHLRCKTAEEKARWLEAIDMARLVFLNNQTISSKRHSASYASRLQSSIPLASPNRGTQSSSRNPSSEDIPSTPSRSILSPLFPSSQPSRTRKGSSTSITGPTTAAASGSASVGAAAAATTSGRSTDRSGSVDDGTTADADPPPEDEVNPLLALLVQCMRTRQCINNKQHEVRLAQKRLIKIAANLKDANFREEVKSVVIRIISLLDEFQSVAETQLLATEKLVTEESNQRRKMERSIKFFAKQNYQMEKQMGSTSRSAKIVRRRDSGAAPPISHSVSGTAATGSIMVVDHHMFDRAEFPTGLEADLKSAARPSDGHSPPSGGSQGPPARKGSPPGVSSAAYRPVEEESDDDDELSGDASETLEFFDVEEDEEFETTSLEHFKESEELSRQAAEKLLPSDSSAFLSTAASAKPGSTSLPDAGEIERRTVLPKPRTEFKIRLWSLLKGCIGKDLSRISIPVYFNEPTSLLQRFVEDNQYTWLLKEACDKSRSVERLLWVCLFSISPYASAVGRTYKPFNPLLGETAEFSHRGFRFLAEQIGHHPPVSAYHCENEHFVTWGSMVVNNRFTGKSLEVSMPGAAHIFLPTTSDKDHYTFGRSKMVVNNIIFGRLILELFGVVTVVNHITGDYAVIEFLRKGWWDTEYHRIRGLVFDRHGEAVYRIGGNWSREVWVEDCGPPASPRNNRSPPSPPPPPPPPGHSLSAPLSPTCSTPSAEIYSLSASRGVGNTPNDDDDDDLTSRHCPSSAPSQRPTRDAALTVDTPARPSSSDHPRQTPISTARSPGPFDSLTAAPPPPPADYRLPAHPQTFTAARFPSSPQPLRVATQSFSDSTSSALHPLASSDCQPRNQHSTPHPSSPGISSSLIQQASLRIASESDQNDTAVPPATNIAQPRGPTNLSQANHQFPPPPMQGEADEHSRPRSLLCRGLRCLAKTPPAIAEDFTLDWDSYETDRASRRIVWRPDPRPSYCGQYYEFGWMTFELNELSNDYNPAEGAVMPPTDARFRPDLRAYEMGDVDLANTEKNRIEELQRGRARMRKNGEADYKPRWFFRGKNSVTGEPCWLFNGEYWEQKCAGKFTGCMDIF